MFVNLLSRTKGGITLEALPTKEGGQVGVLLFRPDDERVLGLKDAADGRALFEVCVCACMCLAPPPLRPAVTAARVSTTTALRRGTRRPLAFTSAKSHDAALCYLPPQELFPQFAGMVEDEAYERLALQEVSRLPAFSYTGPVLHLGKSAVLLGESPFCLLPLVASLAACRDVLLTVVQSISVPESVYLGLVLTLFFRIVPCFVWKTGAQRSLSCGLWR